MLFLGGGGGTLKFRNKQKMNGVTGRVQIPTIINMVNISHEHEEIYKRKYSSGNFCINFVLL